MAMDSYETIASENISNRAIALSLRSVVARHEEQINTMQSEVAAAAAEAAAALAAKHQQLVRVRARLADPSLVSEAILTNGLFVGTAATVIEDFVRGGSQLGAPGMVSHDELIEAARDDINEEHVRRAHDAIMEQIIAGISNPLVLVFTAQDDVPPDYDDFVERVMDLSTITDTLMRTGRRNGYPSAEAWMTDVRQIATNARMYHEADEDVQHRWGVANGE